MSVLIFHPSVAPFVQQAARALEEAGELERLVTTVRDDPRACTQRAACGIGRLLGRDLAVQFRRRAVTEIPLAKVESHPSGELLRVATATIDSDGRATDFVWEWSEIRFDRSVARMLHRGLSGVYGFEYSSLATFQRARALGLPVAYDVPAPESRFVQGLLDAEMQRFPELRTAYHRYTAVREERRIARRRAEWLSASLVIAASRFTRDSYARAGLPVEQVRIVPYGAPPPAPRDLALRTNAADDAPLVLVWAGTFSVRKGAHYLIDAWRRGNFGRHARLHVYGAVAVPDRVLHPLPDGVELGGSIPRDELMKQFQRADALVFPTLCDGFGMVATEAWSCGLPVITTDRAGAADLLKSGENGLLIRAGEAAAIGEALDWCLTHRAQLHTMREAALATASHWQWADYRGALRRALQPLFVPAS